MEKIYKLTATEVQDILWEHLKNIDESVNDDDKLSLLYGDYPNNFEEVSDTDFICLKVS